MTLRLVYAVTDDQVGYEPFITWADGTNSDLLKDIFPGTSGGSGSDLMAQANGIGYFAAIGSLHTGLELWRTDGTAAGTQLLKDIVPGSGGSAPSGFFAVGDTIFFTASDSTNGRELWATDGTADGTRLVKDIVPGVGGQYVNILAAFNGKLIFSAGDGLGSEMWGSDGTADGTQLLADINPNGFSFPQFSGAVLGGKLFFSADNGVNGRELYTTDGTTVEFVKDIQPGSSSGVIESEFLPMGSFMYFIGFEEATGASLWRSDGSADGTTRVADIPAGFASGNMFLDVVAGNKLFFRANDGEHGQELWVSDGTRDGTRMVDDLNTGGDGVSTDYDGVVARLGTTNKVIFAGTPLGGPSLFVSDGTANGTKDLIGFRDYSLDAISNVTAVGDLVYFVATTAQFVGSGPEGGREIWVTDGTRDGTHVVTDVSRNGVDRDPLLLGILDVIERPTPGPDRLTGTAGRDTIDGLAGRDVIFGRGDDDELTGSSGNDYLYGENGLDDLRGGSGADYLYGGNKSDTIMGDGGRDRLIGGAGNDVLTGGKSTDYFVFENRWGQDTITDLRSSEKIDLRDADVTFADLTIRGTNGGDDALVIFGKNRITLTGVDADNLTQARFLFDA